MISNSGQIRIEQVGSQFDVLIYGLGYESRSTTLSRELGGCEIHAVRLPEVKIFSFEENLFYAYRKDHIIWDDSAKFCSQGIPRIFERDGPVRMAIDISAMNRTLLYEILTAISLNVRIYDVITAFYCPSSYSAPSPSFPQIERIGPVSPVFSAFNIEQTRPVALILGAGFEAGVALGIVTQLEPEIGYCFWGGGVDPRFDDAVRKANFEFKFNGYSVTPVKYEVGDASGTYRLLENLTYGLARDYNIVFVLLGPKIFSLISGLVAMSYLGRVSVWRVQHSLGHYRDATPNGTTIFAVLDNVGMMEFANVYRTFI